MPLVLVASLLFIRLYHARVTCLTISRAKRFLNLRVYYRQSSLDQCHSANQFSYISRFLISETELLQTPSQKERLCKREGRVKQTWWDNTKEGPRLSL